MEGATASFQQLDADLAQVASGSQQRVSMANLGGGNAKVQGGRGHVMINVSDGSGTNCTVVDADLGRVVYERAGQTLAYQGGAVFLRTGESANGTVVSPPPFQYRSRNGEPTLSLPLVLVEGSAGSDDLTLERASHRTRFPGASCPSLSSARTDNPMEYGQQIRIEITSDFYRAWGRAFEQATGEDPAYDDSAAQVEVELTRADTRSPVTAGITTSEVTELKVDNHAWIGSYDSREKTHAPYTTGSGGDLHVRGEYNPSGNISVEGNVIATGRGKFDPNTDPPRNHVEGRTILGQTAGEQTEVNGRTEFRDVFSTKDDLHVDGASNTSGERAHFEGDVYVGGNVTHFAKAHVEGDLYVQGDVAFNNSVMVDGDVVAGGDVVNDSDTPIVGGTINEHAASVPEPMDPSLSNLTSVSDEIDDVESDLAADNDNDTAPETALSTWGGCNPCTLTAGEYYLSDGIRLGTGERLVLDTSDGPIDIYAGPNPNNPDDQSVHVWKAKIEVQGSERARIYADRGFQLGESTGVDAAIRVYDESGTETRNAPQFQLYMRPSAKAELSSGNPVFTGLLYGPGDPDGTNVTFTNNATVYGAMVGEITNVNRKTNLYFDEALAEADVVGDDDGNVTSNPVSYVHVSTTTVSSTD